MKIIDLYHETRTSLLSNMTRTGLTILGIVIGIASVIVMLAVGQGAQDSINSTINSLGSNVITIRSGGGTGRPGEVNSGAGLPLTIDDALAIRDKVLIAKEVLPIVQTSQQIVSGSVNSKSAVLGITPNYADVNNIKIDEGTFITEAQNRSFSKVVVLGATVKDNLFGTDNAIGKQIKIKTNSYIVVGVALAKGGGGFSNPDENIYMPLTTEMQYLTGGNNVGNIVVTAAKSEDLAQLQEEVTTLMLKRHKIEDKTQADFRIINQAELLSTASSITSIFTILLGSVAGISLVVGGIGIMNMMLTTVRERTKEIGLRKAIGAQKKDIQSQFLAEAVVITMTGGIIGIILGYLLSALITYSGLITTSVSTFSVLLSFTVSAVIGIVFGYYPAKKASELNPIDALRYE